jgi:hypothetical protein
MKLGRNTLKKESGRNFRLKLKGNSNGFTQREERNDIALWCGWCEEPD